MNRPLEVALTLLSAFSALMRYKRGILMAGSDETVQIMISFFYFLHAGRKKKPYVIINKYTATINQSENLKLAVLSVQQFLES